MSAKVRINNVVSEFTGIAPEVVTAEHTFEQMGLDSLEIIEMTLELEEAFACNIPADTGGAWNSVGDIYRYFECE